MSTLLFFDDGHRYQVDGEDVPSVSELTRFLARELYKDTPQWAMDEAARKGTAIHKATEAGDKYGSCETDNEIAPYVKAYITFKKEQLPEWEKIEWPVCYEKQFAGTVDRYGTMNGKHIILDIKSTSKISGLHKTVYTAQLNLYRMAVMKEKPVDELWVLQLQKEGTYKLHQIPVDDTLAQACLTLHQAIQKTKRRRKK